MGPLALRIAYASFTPEAATFDGFIFTLTMLELPLYSLLIAWVFERSGRSMAIAIAFHAGAHLDHIEHAPRAELGLHVACARPRGRGSRGRRGAFFVETESRRVSEPGRVSLRARVERVSSRLFRPIEPLVDFSNEGKELLAESRDDRPDADTHRDRGSDE